MGTTSPSAVQCRPSSSVLLYFFPYLCSMRNLASIGISIFAMQFNSHAQNSYLPLHRDIMLYNYEKKDSLHGFHSSIKPYLQSEIRIDSSFHIFETSKQNTVSQDENQSLKFSARPLINGMFGAGTGHISRTSAGAGISLQAGNKFSMAINYLLNYESFPRQDAGILDSGFIPHYGKFFSRSKSNVYGYQDLTGYLSWSPYNFLNIELGKDRNFWGDGYRSLFLSDNSNSYPFLKTTFTAWRIKYVSLLAFLKDVDLPGNINALHPKFCALHYLSWNVTNRLNISFYESVTFNSKDSANTTAFDFQFVNPVIFYQPVNRTDGSPGKLHLGMGSSYNFFDEYKLYAQFLLGEFVLKDFFGGTGWWGNKYGIQMGIQSPEAFKIHGFHLLFEGNLVRPYTYSHSNTLSNYGDYMQPLAHPLGANFIEGLIEARYIRGKNIFGLVLIHSITGLDSSNINFGQNIYHNYTTRSSDFGVWLLQGMRSDYTAMNVSYSRIILPKWNVIMEAGLNGSYTTTQGHGVLESYVYISLKTLLNNDEPFKY
jgi:hypothetical protein